MNACSAPEPPKTRCQLFDVLLKVFTENENIFRKIYGNNKTFNMPDLSFPMTIREFQSICSQYLRETVVILAQVLDNIPEQDFQKCISCFDCNSLQEVWDDEVRT